MKPPVLCVKTTNLFGVTHDSYFHGFAGPAILYNVLIGSKEIEWRDRNEAEKDPAYKQIIPYVCLYHRESESFLTYRRGKSGDENRLHEKRSIGFGGHIDHAPVTNVEFEDWVFSTALRELEEEIKFKPNSDQQFHMIGYVNEDESEVGRVHFGVCFLISITDNQKSRLLAAETCIEDLRFVHRDELYADGTTYELWSRMLLNGLVYNRTTLIQLA